MVGSEFAVGIDLNITRFIDLEDRASSDPARRSRARGRCPVATLLGGI